MEQQNPPSSAYDAVVKSALLSGEAKLAVGADGLVCDTLFERQAVAFRDVERVEFSEYSVVVHAGGRLAATRMGQAAEWFYRELLGAYHRRVLQALGVEGEPGVKTRGSCSGGCTAEEADIWGFGDCLCVLPPHGGARRIPFAFVSGLRQEGHGLTVLLSTGEEYSFAMLGRDLEPLKKRVEDGVRTLRDTNLEFVKKLAGELGFAATAEAARVLRQGVAAELQKLPQGLRQAVEAKVKNSKMGPTYAQLKAICNAESLAVGLRELPEEEVERLKEKLLEARSGEEQAELTPEEEDALRWEVWAVAPSLDGQHAVVEFGLPGEDAATYVFSTGGGWPAFLQQANRALEASGLAREVFSLSEQELANEKHTNSFMLAARTPAIQALRGQFKGRAIHRSVEGWKRSVLGLMASAGAGGTQGTGVKRFCTGCGAQLNGAAKFCGACGMKIE